MIKLSLTKSMSLPHEVFAKYGSSKVQILPNKGRGLVAGTVVRDILNLAGVKDVTAKVMAGTKKLNNSKSNYGLALSQVASKYKKPTETTVVNNQEISKVVE